VCILLVWFHNWGPASLFLFIQCDSCSFGAAPMWHHNRGPSSLFLFTMRPLFLLCGSYMWYHIGPCLPVPLYNATHVPSLRLPSVTTLGPCFPRHNATHAPSVRLVCVTTLGPCPFTMRLLRHSGRAVYLYSTLFHSSQDSTILYLEDFLHTSLTIPLFSTPTRWRIYLQYLTGIITTQ
jgi:hypothetical protein